MAAVKSSAQIAWHGSAQVRRFQEEMARRRSEEARRIGANIAVLRERHHLTQEVAARKLKVAYRTYQSWEEGTSVPRWATRERIAKFYGVPVEGINGPPTPQDDGLVDQLDRIEAMLEDLYLRLIGECFDESTAEVVGQLPDRLAETDESLSKKAPARSPSRPAASRSKRA